MFAVLFPSTGLCKITSSKYKHLHYLKSLKHALFNYIWCLYVSDEYTYIQNFNFLYFSVPGKYTYPTKKNLLYMSQNNLSMKVFFNFIY